jgi:hypothetical protein
MFHFLTLIFFDLQHKRKILSLLYCHHCLSSYILLQKFYQINNFELTNLKI